MRQPPSWRRRGRLTLLAALSAVCGTWALAWHLWVARLAGGGSLHGGARSEAGTGTSLRPAAVDADERASRNVRQALAETWLSAAWVRLALPPHPVDDGFPVWRPAAPPLSATYWAPGVDWHDLVRDDEVSGSAEMAERLVREVRKATLLAAVQHTAVGDAAEADVARWAAWMRDWVGRRRTVRDGQGRRFCAWLRRVATDPPDHSEGDAHAGPMRAVMVALWTSTCTPQRLVAWMGGGQPPSVPWSPPPITNDNTHTLLADETHWGPLHGLHLCDVVRDPCIVHQTQYACIDDELCGWCDGQGGWGDHHGRCMSRLPPQPQHGKHDGGGGSVGAGVDGDPQRCPTPLWVAHSSLPATAAAFTSSPVSALHYRDGVWSLRTAAASSCDVVVTRRAAHIISFGTNSNMAYHFLTETLPAWHAGAARSKCADHLRCHVWVQMGKEGAGTASQASFVRWAHLTTNTCPRYPRHAPSKWRAHGHGATGICYAHVAAPSEAAGDGKLAHGGGRSAGMVALTGLPPPQPVQVDAHGNEVAGRPPPPSLLSALTDLGTAVSRGHRLGLVAMRRILHHTLCTPAATAALAHGSAGLDGDGELGFTAGDMEAACARLTKLVGPDVVRKVEVFSAVGTGTWWLHPSGHHVVVLRRMGKRFVLNEGDVVATAVRAVSMVPSRHDPTPIQATVARLENMPLYAQIALFRTTTMLIGMHGSGLVNSMFMPRGGGVIQLVPPALTGAAQFFQPPAMAAGVTYAEYQHQSLSTVSLHPHFLPPSRQSVDQVADLMQRGSDCCGPAIYFSFFINQDVSVNITHLSHVVAQVAARASVQLAVVPGRGGGMP